MLRVTPPGPVTHHPSGSRQRAGDRLSQHRLTPTHAVLLGEENAFTTTGSAAAQHTI